MDRIKIVIILSFLVVLAPLKAQQEQHWTVSSLVNRITINPAYAGSEDYSDFKLGHRTQWVGIDAAPVTTYVTGHTTIGKEYGSAHGHHRGEGTSWFGLGGYIYQDNTGPIRRTGFYSIVSLNTQITKDTRFALGFSLGLKQFRIRPDWNSFDPVEQDDLLLSTEQARLVPDINIGATYYTKNFYVGASIFQATRAGLSFEGLTNDDQEPASRLTNHFFFTGGFKMPFSADFDIVPSFTLRYSFPTVPSLDLSVRANYGDKYFVGGSFRVGDSFSVLGGVLLGDRFEVAYSFDLTNSELRRFNSGTHEIIVGYRLPHKGKLECPGKYWH